MSAVVFERYIGFQYARRARFPEAGSVILILFLRAHIITQNHLMNSVHLWLDGSIGQKFYSEPLQPCQ